MTIALGTALAVVVAFAFLAVGHHIGKRRSRRQDAGALPSAADDEA